MIEELMALVEKLLLQQPQGLSEHQLIMQLKAIPESGYADCDLQQAHSLFQSHFLLFHCLYRIRERWLLAERADLQISSLAINVLPYQQKTSSALAESDNLREYYLDISHLEKTTADDADALLNSFWQKFSAQEEKQEALAVMQLTADADYQEIKEQYRLLMMRHHPDRGGDDAHVASINNAMRVLKRYFQ